MKKFNELLFKSKDMHFQLLIMYIYLILTSPAAVMRLVVFFRSSKPPYNFWWSGVAGGPVRFTLVGVSEEHTRLSGPPHHRDTLGKERFFSFDLNDFNLFIDNKAQYIIPKKITLLRKRYNI